MAKEYAGRALYLELRRDTDVSQVILTPQMYNPTRDSNLKPYIISRSLRPDTQRKGWRYSSGPRLNFISKTGEDIAAGITQVTNQLKWAAPLISGYVAGGWKIVNKPIVVEVSTEDIDDIYAKKTPTALVRRILKARGEAGFPQSVAVTLPHVPKTPAPF